MAAGCTVVLKPAEDTPLSARRFAEICREAGLPDGVLNVITGNGGAGAAPDVDKIGFTGSTATGMAIVRAAAGNLKQVSLKLGGKSPVFIFPDADLDRVMDGVAAHADGLKLGHGLDPASNLGPLISEKQLNRVSGLLDKGLLDKGLSEGATALLQGGRVGDKGFFVKPTVLTGITPEMTVYREEIFGPVISAMKMTTQNIDALAREANNTVYGLGAAIWTRDISVAHRLAARIRAGIIWINNHNQSDANLPWGGFKQSGWGREMGKPAVDLYTEVKSVGGFLGD